MTSVKHYKIGSITVNAFTLDILVRLAFAQPRKSSFFKNLGKMFLFSFLFKAFRVYWLVLHAESAYRVQTLLFSTDFTTLTDFQTS